MSDYLDPNNEELLQDFFAEAESQIELLERNILVLENDTQNRDAVDEVFRAAHTLKGASATVQMGELTEFTHIVEDVFDEVRESRASVTPELVDLLLSAVDIIKNMIDSRSGGVAYDQDISATLSGLKGIVSSADHPAKRIPEQRKEPKPEPTTIGGIDDVDQEELAEMLAAAEGRAVYRVRVTFDESNPMNSVGAIQVFAAFKPIATVLKTAPDFERLYDDSFHQVVDYYVGTDLDRDSIADRVAISEVTLSVIVDSLTAENRTSPEPRGSHAEKSDETIEQTKPPENTVEDLVEDTVNKSEQKSSTADTEAKTQRRGIPTGSVLRVDSRRIDNLLNLVSETVINKGSFAQVASEFAETATLLQQTEEQYRSRLKDLFGALPEYLERMQEGAGAKEVKREINKTFGDLYDQFEPFVARFRQSVGMFRGTTQNLDRITGELQEAVMRIRMVPISQVFSRFPRLVRDLTRSLSKNVSLEVDGEDTELDKSVIEDLLDPLIHCVRNSVDHGLESPDEREKAGKSKEGHLVLRAASEGNRIIIEVADDGRGIDVEAVRKKAIERGLIHPSKALSDAEAYNLILDPGFSTANQVTNISGRGVGLDVVRKQIEKLNGTVTVWSEPGEGTRFTIRIPLTLAIIQGLMVRVGRETYAIPITSVIDSHRIRPHQIRMLDNYEVFDARDEVVSLLRLNRIFRIETDEDLEYYFVVIVGSGDKKVGLIVDSLIGEEDVVIKPLRDRYTNAPGIAGANITGDGKVSLIIDVAELVELGLKHARDARRRETPISS